MNSPVLSYEEARRILGEKKVAAPLDEDYLNIILTFILEILRNPDRNSVEVWLRQQSYYRLKSAPRAACLAIEALLGESLPPRSRAFLSFHEDGKTVEVRLNPETGKP